MALGGNAACLMLLRLDDARETKQGVEFRLTAAESNEIVDRVTARAALENFLQVASPRVGVENAFFFKGAEAVRREDLRPFVAVVTRTVAARKNMREALREAVPSGWEDDGNLTAHGLQQCLHGIRLRIEGRVEQHVKEGELNLTHANAPAS